MMAPSYGRTKSAIFSFFEDSKWRLEEKKWATGWVMRSNSTPSKLCLYYYKYSQVIQSCDYLDTCQCKSLLLLPREPCCDRVPQSMCCHSHKLFSQSWTDVSPLTCRHLTFDYPETLWFVAMESFRYLPSWLKCTGKTLAGLWAKQINTVIETSP